MLIRAISCPLFNINLNLSLALKAPQYQTKQLIDLYIYGHFWQSNQIHTIVFNIQQFMHHGLHPSSHVNYNSINTRVVNQLNINNQLDNQQFLHQKNLHSSLSTQTWLSVLPPSQQCIPLPCMLEEEKNLGISIIPMSIWLRIAHVICPLLR